MKNTICTKENGSKMKMFCRTKLFAYSPLATLLDSTLALLGGGGGDNVDKTGVVKVVKGS